MVSNCMFAHGCGILPHGLTKRSKVEPIRNATLFQMGKVEHAGQRAKSLNVERPFSEPSLLLGASSFTADGWQGSFYPPGMQTRNFLSYYATQFKTTPSASAVMNWYERTPVLYPTRGRERRSKRSRAIPVSSLVTRSLQLRCCNSDLHADRLAAP